MNDRFGDVSPRDVVEKFFARNKLRPSCLVLLILLVSDVLLEKRKKKKIFFLLVWCGDDARFSSFCVMLDT